MGGGRRALVGKLHESRGYGARTDSVSRHWRQRAAADGRGGRRLPLRSNRGAVGSGAGLCGGGLGRGGARRHRRPACATAAELETSGRQRRRVAADICQRRPLVEGQGAVACNHLRLKSLGAGGPLAGGEGPMRPLATRNLLIMATALSGLLAGFNLDRSLVHNAAWHRLGASAWAAYSLNADLSIRAALLYPFLGIGV